MASIHNQYWLRLKAHFQHRFIILKLFQRSTAPEYFTVLNDFIMAPLLFYTHLLKSILFRIHSQRTPLSGCFHNRNKSQICPKELFIGQIKRMKLGLTWKWTLQIIDIATLPHWLL